MSDALAAPKPSTHPSKNSRLCWLTPLSAWHRTRPRTMLVPFLSLDSEEEGLAIESTVATGWEGVVDLIELDDSKKEGRHDLSAMKSLLISLKHKGGAF